MKPIDLKTADLKPSSWHKAEQATNSFQKQRNNGSDGDGVCLVWMRVEVLKAG